MFLVRISYASRSKRPTHNLLRHLPHDLVILGPLLGSPVKSFSQQKGLSCPTWSRDRNGSRNVLEPGFLGEVVNNSLSGRVIHHIDVIIGLGRSGRGGGRCHRGRMLPLISRGRRLCPFRLHYLVGLGWSSGSVGFGPPGRPFGLAAADGELFALSGRDVLEHPERLADVG